MIAHRSKLFRKEALERNASPERLDQLVQIVNPKRWLSLIALGSLVSAGVAWSILGHIPMTVRGQGILVYPSQVTAMQASGSGRVQEVLVRPGQIVKPGEVIVVLDQSELRQQLVLAQSKLDQLQAQATEVSRLQGERGSLEQLTTAQQRRSLLQQLQAAQALTPILREKAQRSLQQERAALEEQASSLRAMVETYRERWQSRQQVNQEAGELVISKDEILESEQAYRDIENQLNQTQTRLSQLALEETQTQQEYTENINQIADLQAQLQELTSRSATQTEQDILATNSRQKEIQETERTITQLTLELSQSQEIRSAQGGEILELSVQPGQQLELGMPVGMIGNYERDNPPMTVAFLPVEEGEKVEKAMEMKVTPTTVKREEYGSIIGEVTQVSGYPITEQEATKLVGHGEILSGILAEGPHVAIHARLATIPDEEGSLENGSCSHASYQWSSSDGPDNQCFSPGTTAQVQVVVEQRTPISFVLPFLKQWVGMG